MNAGQAARSVYAKICALIILTYVMLMCIVGFINWPTISGLRIGLMVGLMFGIPAGLLLGGVPAILYYFHRRAFQGKVKYADDLTTHPTRTIDVDLPLPVGPVDKIMPYDLFTAFETFSKSFSLIPKSVNEKSLNLDARRRSTAFSPSTIGIMERRISKSSSARCIRNFPS